MTDKQIILSLTRELEEAIKPKWVSVNDKMPSYGEPVLLKINGVVQKITYNLDGSDHSNDWFEPYSSIGVYDDHRDLSFFVDYESDVCWQSLPEA